MRVVQMLLVWPLLWVQAGVLLTADGASLTVRSTYIGTIVGRSSTYDYGPSMIRDRGTYRMYWCSSQLDGQGDAIWYATSSDALRWSMYRVVLKPTPYSAETDDQPDGHVCDPTVIRVVGTYYMYYTAASLAGINNQVFLATSADGVTWTKYPSNHDPQPVIANPYFDGEYGIGQATVLFHDGVFYLYYTDAHTGSLSTQVTRSPDGIHWTVGTQAFASNNFVPAYLARYGIFFGVVARDEGSAIGIYYSLSADGVHWDPPTIDEAKKLPVPSSRNSAHNAGILTDGHGQVEGQMTYVYYGSGGTDPPNWDPTAWDIDVLRVTFRQRLNEG